jgi:hypothetical protein
MQVHTLNYNVRCVQILPTWYVVLSHTVHYDKKDLGPHIIRFNKKDLEPNI